jgi:arsenic resistance protein ArsH
MTGRLLSTKRASALSELELALPNIRPDAFERPNASALGDPLRSAHNPRILLLYGSVRPRSYSRSLTQEAARLLDHLGADPRIYDPSGLPLPDDAPEDHPKVGELRELVAWSEGQVWSSPERHGAMSGILKSQIDWIPLNSGAMRPTQGKTLAVMQVSGGSQSFNAVNQMRVLGRWMRMLTIPNQSSVAKAFQEFDEAVLILRPRRRCDGGTGQIHAADARCFAVPHRSLQRTRGNGRRAFGQGQSASSRRRRAGE